MSKSRKKSHASSRAHESTGFVKRHPDGFGFFISDDPNQVDVYVPRKYMEGIMSNDRVRVKITREPGGDRFRGEVTEVLSHSLKRAMGQYYQQGPGQGLLHDKSFAWGEDLKVSCPVDMKVEDGDWVAVQIESYPDSIRGFRGRVIQVIGDAQDPMNDSSRMLHTHSIPYEFSQQTNREMMGLPDEVSPKDFADRRDLRAIDLITIDGQTAKDFDDAVFVERTSTGFRLVVAIADVSHYVKVGTALDEDAYERGVSTYFPGFVAPMLPEKLSNELCSLKPRVPRLSFVADMRLDFQGQMVASEFYEAVIESKARVTYGEAQEVIEGRVPDKLKSVAGNILRCADLAKILMSKRFREGSLDLEIPETEIEIDETGQPVDILQAERLFAHRLIEELMLMANVAVARFFQEKEIPALYRIHEEPKTEAMQSFESFLKAFGYPKRLDGGHLQKKMSQALEHFAEHPKHHILHILALRSLAQAKYSPHNVGHFGLGFDDYTHFTSPIRRYPDLIVHRLMKAVLYPHKGYELMPEGDLESAGVFLSACEQRSVKAERQIRSIKKARFMSGHLGEEFDAMISSVTKFGIFAVLRQFDVDGLIRIEELGDDRFIFDEENLRLVGKRSGMSYEIGDPVRVQVAAAHIEEGQIDFVLAGDQPGKKPDRRPTKDADAGLSNHASRVFKKPAQKAKKRKSSQDDRERVRPSRISRPGRSRKARKVRS